MTNEQLIIGAKEAMEELYLQCIGRFLEHEQTAYNYLRLMIERIELLGKTNDALKNSFETKGTLPLALHIEVLTFAVAILEKEKLELLDRLVRLEAQNAELRAANNKDCEYFEGRKIRITKL